jgi:hypothetical protein
MAKHFGIHYIPQPGGGCILTEKEFGFRVRQLMGHCPKFTGRDILILRNCRPIWEGNSLIAVARNKSECDFLKNAAVGGDILLSPENFMGPTVLLRNYGISGEMKKNIELGKKYLLQYSKKIPARPEIKVIESV